MSTAPLDRRASVTGTTCFTAPPKVLTNARYWSPATLLIQPASGVPSTVRPSTTPTRALGTQLPSAAEAGGQTEVPGAPVGAKRDGRVRVNRCTGAPPASPDTVASMAGTLAAVGGFRPTRSSGAKAAHAGAAVPRHSAIASPATRAIYFNLVLR